MRSLTIFAHKAASDPSIALKIDFHIVHSRDQVPAVPYLQQAGPGERVGPAYARRVVSGVRRRAQQRRAPRALRPRRHPRHTLDTSAQEQHYRVCGQRGEVTNIDRTGTKTYVQQWTVLG